MYVPKRLKMTKEIKTIKVIFQKAKSLTILLKKTKHLLMIYIQIHLITKLKI